MQAYEGGTALGGGIQGGALTDLALLQELQSYRRRVASSYRALRPEDIDSLPHGPMLVSPKIDGELWFFCSTQNEQFLANPRGRVIAGDIPLLKDAPRLPPDSIIAGELSVDVEGRRARVGDLASLLEARQPDLSKMRFAAFDLVRESAQACALPYASRLERLKGLIPGSSLVAVVPTEPLESSVELRKRYERDVATGALEGLIVRQPTGPTLKLKPAITLDAAVIGYTTRIERPNEARSLLLAFIDTEDRFVVFGACGNLGTDQERVDLLAKLTSRRVESEVRYASDSGALYSFVEPGLVAEIVVTDVQAARSDGEIIRSPRLAFEDHRWTRVGLAHSAAPIHPVFSRLRDDKQANASDVRLAQLDPWTKGTDNAGAPASDSGAPSEVIRREVWTKETKGVMAVRKLVVWRTNKAGGSMPFPEFVVHWTDYSPGRASPLDREVRPAPDEQTARDIADQLITENIKKGWVKVV